WRNYFSPTSQSTQWVPSPAPDRATASSGSRIASSAASVHGGLITIRPQAPSLVPARGAATPSSARKILGTPLRRKRRASASGAVPRQVGPARPLAMRGGERLRQPREIAGVLEGGIDENQAAPLLRRHIGVERGPAVDRHRLAAPVAGQIARERGGRVRLEFA